MPARDFLLRDAVGHVEHLLGNEGIVRGAVEAGVGFACGYPGTPSSEVTDSFARIAPKHGIVFEYSVNEKIAVEMTFAASLAGTRSICAMKHLGLMVAGDPLSTIPYVGVGGGMVIVSAGDPSCLVSPNEQDQRALGPMLYLPVLDPTTPQQACDLTREAFELSERSGFPVLMRITTRVAHSRGPVRYGALRPIEVRGFQRDPSRLVPIPVNARRLRKGIAGRLEVAREFIEQAGWCEVSGPGPDAILSAGVPAGTTADLLDGWGAADKVRHIALCAVFPLPETPLLAALDGVERLVVVEELSPFLEDAVTALCARKGLQLEILGKRSGHFPEEFEYEPEVIARGLHDALGLGPEPVEGRVAEAVPARPPVLCPGCPHRSSFFAARAVFGDDHLYFNDIGCYTLGYGGALQSADALLCMGAGFTLAAGVARVTGQRTVGFMGDSTFFHSGMPALLNAVKEEVNMVAVILDNQVTAMTGFQESPGVTVHSAGPQRSVSIAGIARALGAPHVETVDPMDLPATIAALERAKDRTGVSVIIAESPCVVFEAKVSDKPAVALRFEVDSSQCGSCGRECADLRCSQPVGQGFERALTRARALETPASRASSKATPVAPCAQACPLGLCVQGYSAHIAAGNYALAAELIVNRTPLPHSVCRVCHRPCEAVCVRTEIDEHVAINDLKRFVMDRMAADPDLLPAPQPGPDSGRHVAVIGAGPAGLAASHDLRLRGHAVTLYDAAPEPGGLLRSGIPDFRLPAEALQRDVDRILGMGVRFEGGVRLGRDISLGSLLDGGHDAVFVAIGAHRSRRLEVPGEDGVGPPEVVEALAWLADPRTPPPGAQVLVIGGGNAAMDAARTALRLGAAQVTVLYRRGEEQMPALADEIAAARHEGVHLCPWTRPVEVVRDGEPGLACLHTRPGQPDASGRARPEDVPDSLHHHRADLVIVAVGQAVDRSMIGPSDPQLTRAVDGTLVVDPKTAATSDPRVFAGGDLVESPRTVTDAIAWGQRAAWGIDVALVGQSTADELPPPPHADTWTAVAREHRRVTRNDRHPRARPPELPVAERLHGFVETVGVLTEAAARAEAARCMICGMCGNCRACLEISGCPAFYVEGGKILIDAALCNGCGFCAEFCPNLAIVPVQA